MSQDRLQAVDVEKIFKDKNPKLAALIPSFVYRFLKRIIHQEELNTFIGIAGDKMGPDFAQAYIDYANIKVSIKGEENLPKMGDDRVIFAANHPLGGLDGIALIDQLGHRYPGVKFMVNDILMHMINLRPVFLPINKHGGQARDAAKAIQSAHQEDGAIFTFPAGLVSRRQNGVVKDLKWGKNVIANAIRYKRDIVPIHVSGTNSRFFYSLANWRKRLGIKANLEMLFLVDETWKNSNMHMYITIGERISYKTFTKEKSRDAWAEDLKNAVYQLPE